MGRSPNILRRVATLDAEQLAAVEKMVALHLKKHADDTEQTLSAISALRSTIKPPEPPRRRRYRCSRCTILVSSRHWALTEPTAPSASPSGWTAADSERYRVLRPHARGALGVVFVALDTELHREVAIKEILDHHADNAASRARFLLEAEVTGGLEHPGIVPVYGLGDHADGRPYYAMRFIRGGTLKEAIDQFHADAAMKSETGRRSLELRKLLRRFIDVCNAIDYAHNRGVHSPRHQAQQHRRRQVRRNAGGRLGSGQADRADRAEHAIWRTTLGSLRIGRVDRNATRLGHGDARLYEPRAGRGGLESPWTMQRRLQPGRYPVLRAHRQATVRGQ